jgi:acetate kinase
MRVLVINCGSSSLKFDLIDVEGRSAQVRRLARGIIDRVGGEAIAELTSEAGTVHRPAAAPDQEAALAEAVALLADAGLLAAIDAVGHRVVHGGSAYTEPAVIDDEVVAAIESASALAPLHNGPALAAIRAARRRFAATPMVACFDTAFYARLPQVAALYALPLELSRRLAIRRYGFHGLAHRYMVERFRALRPEVARPRLITLHLGNGCSATASLGGRPLDTSMGFTPLEGLIMGSRSGDLDPALPLFIAEREDLSLAEVETLLNFRSGLRGLSGLSNDMRDLVAAAAMGNERAALAVDAFCYRVRKYVGAYLSVLGGVDAVVFGGGIGENSVEVRERVCRGLEWTGLRFDQAANRSPAGGDRRVSAAGPVEAWVVAVDEASVLARDTAACLLSRRPWPSSER